MSPTENTFLARHLQFVVAAGCGIAAAVVAGYFNLRLAFPAGADMAFAVYCALVLREMPKLTAAYLSKRARAADLPLLLIFIVTAAVVAASVLSLFQVINSKGSPHPAELAFALLAIPLGWFTIHAMTALHYAHVYWIDDEETDSDSKSRQAPSAALLSPARNGRKAGISFIFPPPSA